MGKSGNILKYPQELIRTPENRAILGGIILILVVIIIFASSYFGTGKKEKAKVNISLTEEIVGEIKTEPGEPSQFESDELFSCSGNVILVDENNIYFESHFIRDYKLVKATLQAVTTPQTDMVKRDMLAYYEAGPINSSGAGVEKIELKDIKPGDSIMVISGTNIKNASSFEVTKVEIQYNSDQI